MENPRALSYPSHEAILQNLSFRKRSEIARRIPSLRGLNNRLPFNFHTVKMRFRDEFATVMIADTDYADITTVFRGENGEQLTKLVEHYLNRDGTVIGSMFIFGNLPTNVRLDKSIHVQNLFSLLLNSSDPPSGCLDGIHSNGMSIKWTDPWAAHFKETKFSSNFIMVPASSSKNSLQLIKCRGITFVGDESCSVDDFYVLLMRLIRQRKPIGFDLVNSGSVETFKELIEHFTDRNPDFKKLVENGKDIMKYELDYCDVKIVLNERVTETRYKSDIKAQFLQKEQTQAPQPMEIAE